MSQDLAFRIQKRLIATGKSARGASLEAGLSDAFIRNILEGKSKSPRSDTLAKLAPILGTSEAWLLKEEGPEVGALGTGSAAIIPDRDLYATGETLPVYAAAKGGDGHVIVTFEEIERVRMPQVLQGVVGGYGLLIDGESMVPAFFPGDTALVHPHLKPERGHNHIFYHKPSLGGEEEAIVKQLVAFNDREWTLKQWNPLRTWKESRQIWQTCHRVVGKYDRK